MNDEKGIVNAPIQQYRNKRFDLLDDALCIEEPIEFRIPFQIKGGVDFRTLAITMRTPGNDIELATGFLYSEGIISKASDILGFRYCDDRGEAGHRNSLEVQLKSPLLSQNHDLERRFTTYSGCGLCGKTSLQSIELQTPPELDKNKEIFEMKLLSSLSQSMITQQSLFQKTGSAHASGLFDLKGNLLNLFEDVGRHNALDKLIGYHINHQPELMKSALLFVSGRTSFELVQKTIMAGIPILASVGAPSSLALDTAKRFNLTLLGFLTANSFNIYNAPWRIKKSKS